MSHSSSLARGHREHRGLEPERRRRLGELRCLSPLPLGGRAATPAPLPGGGCEPVSARASPLPQACPSPSPKGTRSLSWGLGTAPTVHRDSAPDPGVIRPPPATPENDPTRADAARVQFRSGWRGTPASAILSAGAARRDLNFSGPFGRRDLNGRERGKGVEGDKSPGQALLLWRVSHARPEAGRTSLRDSERIHFPAPTAGDCQPMSFS